MLIHREVALRALGLKIRAVMLAAVATFGLAFNGQPARAEKIQIAVGIDPAYVPFFVADANKLFEKAGLEVVLTKYSHGADGLDAVIAGTADISAAAEPTVMIRMGRSDMRSFLIAGRSDRYLKLVTRSGIKTVADIKTYGMVPGSSMEFLTFKTLQAFNIPQDSVKLIKGGPPEMPALLIRGDIDAFWLFEPFVSMAQKQGGQVLMTSGAVGYNYTFWVAAKGSWLQSHGDAAHKVGEALAEACAQVRADPKVGAVATQAEVKIPVVQTLDFLKQVDCTVSDFQPGDFASYDAVADIMAERKITPARVDYRKALDTGFFKQ